MRPSVVVPLSSEQVVLPTNRHSSVQVYAFTNAPTPSVKIVGCKSSLQPMQYPLIVTSLLGRKHHCLYSSFVLKQHNFAHSQNNTGQTNIYLYLFIYEFIYICSYIWGVSFENEKNVIDFTLVQSNSTRTENLTELCLQRLTELEIVHLAPT